MPPIRRPGYSSLDSNFKAYGCPHFGGKICRTSLQLSRAYGVMTAYPRLPAGESPQLSTTSSSKTLTVSTALMGPPISAAARVSLMDDVAFELLVQAWMPVTKKKYLGIERFGGAGDMGRDVVGWMDAQKCAGVWDNVQCKRLANPLAPAVLWPELGKVLWHVSQGDYAMPRSMLFFCSKGIGTTAKHLLTNPEKLRDGLIENWDKNVASKITEKAVIPLNGALKALVTSADFSIFGPLSVEAVLEDLKGTAYYLSQFGGGFPDRPTVPPPPMAVQAQEERFVSRLLAVYAERQKRPTLTLTELDRYDVEKRHFNEMRRQFYSADALEKFVRDITDPAVFAAFQEAVHAAVIPVYLDEHPSGYRRLNQSLAVAGQINTSSNAVFLVAEPLDKQGVCHQLVNQEKLKCWVNP